MIFTNGLRMLLKLVLFSFRRGGEMGEKREREKEILGRKPEKFFSFH